jgi:hypothetical protein
MEAVAVVWEDFPTGVRTNKDTIRPGGGSEVVGVVDGGRDNNNRAPGRTATFTSHPRPRMFAYSANIFLPMDRRGRLIGTGGRMIKSLTETTHCSIHVPKRNPNHNDTNAVAINDVRSAVHVKAGEISHLMHACWKISQIALEESQPDHLQETLQCQLRLGRNAGPLGPINGTLQRDACFFLTVPLQQQSDSNNNVTLQESRGTCNIGAYCIPIHNNLCSSDQIHVLVDNARFSNPELQVPEYAIATMEEHPPEDDGPKRLLFVFGDTVLSRKLYDVLMAMVRELNASMKRKDENQNKDT